ncbi:Fe(3+)-hydroxamate ABC transporter permease FhuB [Cohnella faecalis]|uniref:Fe(3+)-hydroxamate ABC transporter permease FhuB n=1 Tax=Cohnella faecalis TaxID=2315694 RepID=A0A398CIQ5_9BACL|nr:Fe(3+)-hydroxamate ABC transporter permease FhuB [Cohnella faecalis]RIE01079.1 Fe(3+)-hydroxamate ABC transporter permease FhuB [Cohnella faecalis]
MLVAGLIALAVIVFVSLTQGLAHVSVRSVIEALLSPQPDVTEHQLIRGMRLPRTVMGLLAGAALAIAGALMQSVTRNPLASETTLGVNAGAYLVVVVGTIFWPAILHQYSLLFAVAGGAGAAAAVYVMGGGRKSTPVRITLSGMIVTLVCGAITSALQMLNEQSTQGIFLWGSGSLVQNDWDGVQFTWLWVIGGIAAVLLSVRHLDLLAFSEDTARSLGQKIIVIRAFAMGVAILLACVTVSVVGPIGFIGLMAPHIVRLTGLTRHGWLIPISAVWGAVILVGADTIARAFIASYGELPAGAITAIIGAPWLIWLALRTAHRADSASAGASAVRLSGGSGFIPYKVWVVFLTALLVAVWIFNLMSGALDLTVWEVLQALTGGGDEMAKQIVLDFRLPRLLTAGLAGMALAISGTLLQSSVRNPLADPQVVGVTSGAGFGAMLLMLVVPGAAAGWIPVGAVIGGVAAAAVVYASAWRRGLSPTVLVLVGIAVSAAGSAFINLFVIRAKLTLAPALAWLAGSTYGRSWSEVWLLLPLLLVLAPIAWWMGRRVDLLSFSDESSTGLGLSVRRTRLATGLIAVLLASVAAACVGSIGFIGLLAPHASRMLAGTNHRRSMLLSALLGGVLLATADWLGRTVLEPKEIPSGLVAALMGAPYLFLLMMRSRTK